uniref:C2H2-type domain-containing protein n=1 Tax=Timema poppense TaxID=170557 RepID=A0A7R9CXR3_TIMPO|nr:unnamed protein product [Timema poppensis]
MPIATLVDLVTSVPGGENVDEENIKEGLECDAIELGLERLTGVEITNKAMGVNEKEEEQSAWMTHKTALQHSCGKRFTEYSSLYKHHMVHTQQKPYYCTVCARHYRQASTLTMHKRTAHNIVEADDGTDLVVGETVFTLTNNINGSKKLKNIASNVLSFSKDGNSLLTLDASDDSTELHNSEEQFIVIADPSHFAALQCLCGESTWEAQLLNGALQFGITKSSEVEGLEISDVSSDNISS